MPNNSSDLPAATAPADIPSDIKLWRMSVETYHAMARAGVLSEDEPVELLEGWLVHKMTKNPPHTVSTLLVQQALQDIFPAGWFIRSQEPVTLENSEPEPDVAVVRGTIRDYVKRHPGGDDIALVVEVSDSTLMQDRDTKKRIYARAGIPVYWLINLIDRQIEVYWEPSGATTHPDHHRRHDYRPGDEVPVMLDEELLSHVAVNDLLPQ